jgi:hypothetical protein
MNDDMIASTLEPAITPAFLAQLEQLARWQEAAERPDMSWVTYLLNAMTLRAPQPQAVFISPTGACR